MTEQDFQRIFAGLTPHGWLTEAEARLLVQVAESTDGDLVEVGCYQGRASALLAYLGRTLHCVDPWDDAFHDELSGEVIFQSWLANVTKVPSPIIIPYRMRVEDWTPRPAGLVYLDGDHTYRGTLAQVAKGKECKPQTIAIHDVNDSGGGVEVRDAALDMLGPWRERVERVAVWRLR